MEPAMCLIAGWYWVAAVLSKSCKCWSVRELRFFDLMLVIAENPAWQTYELPNIVRTFLQSFESSGKSLTLLYFIQKSLCLLRGAELCCRLSISSCSAPSSPPSSFMFDALAVTAHAKLCAFPELTKNGHRVGPHCLKCSRALAGHTECLRGPRVGQHWLRSCYTTAATKCYF